MANSNLDDRGKRFTDPCFNYEKLKKNYPITPKKDYFLPSFDEIGTKTEKTLKIELNAAYRRI